MGYITKFGTVWGQVPVTTGSVYFVAPASSSTSSYTIENRAYPASDDNDGLSPERALATVNRAIALATANNGDVIVLLPGTHNASSAVGATAAGNIAVTKAGLTIMGLVGVSDDLSDTHGVMPPLTTLTAPAATVVMSVTAANVTVLNLNFLGITQKACLDFTTAANSLTVRRCFFDLATGIGHAGGKGIAATGATQAPVKLLIQKCTFEEDNTGTSHGAAIDVGAAIGFRVERCDFHNIGTGAAGTAWLNVIKVNDVAHGKFASNTFYTLIGGTLAITAGVTGVSMTGTGEIQFHRNDFSVLVTTPLTGFAAGDCDLLLNYVATVAGGTGGTLITSTT